MARMTRVMMRDRMFPKAKGITWDIVASEISWEKGDHCDTHEAT